MAADHRYARLEASPALGTEGLAHVHRKRVAVLGLGNIGGQLAQHLTTAHLHGADLGDRVLARGTAGGLQVEHDEGDLAQGCAQFVERQLGRRSGEHGHGR